MGTSKLIDSSTAYRSEVPGRNSPLAVQELQIGGTSAAYLKFFLRKPQTGLRSISPARPDQ
jgi:hypothetical protein